MGSKSEDLNHIVASFGKAVYCCIQKLRGQPETVRIIGVIMVQAKLLEEFEMLVRVQSYLRTTEVVRHNPMAYGYNLTYFVSEDGYFDRREAERFVTSSLERVRWSLLND